MLTLGVATVPVSAHAGVSPPPLLLKKKNKKADGLTPEEAAERRAPVQQQGQQMVGLGELTAATILYDGAAQSEGDPVLFLDAADVYLQMAKDDREIASAETAKMRAQTAQDILYFHLDSASDPDYRQVANEDVSGLLARAGALIDDADATIAEIEGEQDAVVPTAAPKRTKGNGRGLRIAGAGFIGLGAAGLGLGVAGMAIGRVNQKRVDDPAIYGTEFDAFDAKGRRGNVLAGVGLAVGGVGLALGVTMLIIGKRRAKNAGSAPQESPSDEEASVAIVPTGRGLALTGRF